MLAVYSDSSHLMVSIKLWIKTLQESYLEMHDLFSVRCLQMID